MQFEIRPNQLPTIMAPSERLWRPNGKIARLWMGTDREHTRIGGHTMGSSDDGGSAKMQSIDRCQIGLLIWMSARKAVAIYKLKLAARLFCQIKLFNFICRKRLMEGDKACERRATTGPIDSQYWHCRSTLPPPLLAATQINNYPPIMATAAMSERKHKRHATFRSATGTTNRLALAHTSICMNHWRTQTTKGKDTDREGESGPTRKLLELRQVM